MAKPGSSTRNQPIKTILSVPSMEFQQLIWYDNPPSSIQSHPNNLQIPPRHPPTPSRQPKSIDIGVVKGIGKNYFLSMTLDWPLGVCWVLGRCLGGVLGCMSDSGYCLGGKMCEQLINTQYTNLY